MIAGHNGIGKSTILALLAHPSGLTNRSVDEVLLTYSKQINMSYMDKTFQANFNEIIHIDYVAEYTEKLGPPKTLSEPQVTYSVNGTDTVVKACRLGPRPGVTNGPQLGRVVARTIKPTTGTFLSSDGKIIVGAAGKVPLPTIYLGMTRVLPLGEAEPGTASSTQFAMHADDAKLIADFQNSVISGSKASSAAITTQRIKTRAKFLVNQATLLVRIACL